MADPRGFLKYAREDNPKRPVEQRRTDWHELYAPLTDPAVREGTEVQAARCMDCGIPFCHSGGAGCPLGNLIPEWNDFVRRGEWDRASERLHATNNFPEFTGALCPAPCEVACVLAITSQPGPVAIKRVEWSIAENGWADGLVSPQVPSNRTGRRVAVVGSGPAGLAAAQQLTRAGHDVTVFERDDRLGGLLRYGIPEFKFEKWEIDRRLEQMRAEGTRFVVDCEVGGPAMPVERLRAEHDAVVLAVGALAGRDDRTIEGRDLDGVHLAMDYLVPANRECEGDGPSPINARGGNVVIIGGGDTGADCYGTATRQGALAVHQLDQYPPPPRTRQESTSPWPTWPYVFRTPPALEEGGERLFATAVRRFVGDDRGHVRAVELSSVEVRRDADGRREVVPTSEEVHEMPADLVLFSIGFTGPDDTALLPALGIERTPKGAIGCGSDWQTDAPGVFVCGDAHRGASLIVWAIAEGRSAAAAVDRYLDPDGTTDLPAPLHPGALPLSPAG
ncbi:glutamate synthase subunit beta [Actinomycetospora flava]|uniref:Glutamate synthase subunit beta n=1 Tax=Actinomycetospora flava TaxID=3129232 RepID=A0ABU8LXD1_9PSEU